MVPQPNFLPWLKEMDWFHHSGWSISFSPFLTHPRHLKQKIPQGSFSQRHPESSGGSVTPVILI